MEWKLLTQADQVTTTWSGGTTTQLAIAPEGAVYADRDFLWRLSSAGVELEHSDFTPLPDYNRLISVLHGELEMKIGDGARFGLEPFTLRSFDGGVPVESWGKCTDYNLMVRKDKCQGIAQSIALTGGATCRWTAPLAAPQEGTQCTLALYCVQGGVSLPQAGVQAQEGQLLLCRQADEGAVELKAHGDAVVMAAAIYTR